MTAPPTPEPSDDDDAAVAAWLPHGTQELGIDDALALAIKLHRADRLDGAVTLYRRILQALPGHADAACLLGMALHQMGRGEDGLVLMRDAIARVPGFAGFRLNLGNVLSELNRLDEALDAYQGALALQPESADLHNNIGALHRVQGRLAEAQACYERALALDRQHLRAWNNLGLVLDAQGRLDEAARAYLAAIDLVSEPGASMQLLGRTFYRLGQHDKAAAVFRQWMAREPGNPVPVHLHAAASGQAVPPRASDAYVEAEFDKFAASFERVLNERLHYRAPQLCADLLQAQRPAPARALQVLDAGCGTGLCGPLVAPWAQRLVGVDLSAGMLARARSKGVYDELIKAELTAFLADGRGRWDVIVCADTLCYFGDLHPVMAAAGAALRPDGVLVFTVEALDDDARADACIQPSGRYAHGRAHLDAVLAAAGLQLLQARREVLRDEAGAAVQGWLVAAAPTGAAGNR